jgi:hypothetical protein
VQKGNGSFAGPERRNYERLPVPLPIFVRGVDANGKDFLEFATALNISAGGALVAVRRYMPQSSNISLEIPSAPPQQIQAAVNSGRNFHAQVIRVTNSDRCDYWALQFSQPLV